LPSELDKKCKGIGINKKHISQMTTLENSYCVPKTEEEFILLGYDRVPNFHIKGNRVYYAILDETDQWTRSVELYSNLGNLEWLTNEIPIQHFIDLVEDRISAWRLEEVGFIDHGTQFIGVFGSSHIHFTKSNGRVTVTPYDHGKGINAYITTFTELLTLIKFLTPPTK